ncbi:MAG: hypothetical protein M1334_04530 [Patescibacteria group bacterium]|nr:hypothetical protein [Patescibacteria group bacterium]
MYNPEQESLKSHENQEIDEEAKSLNKEIEPELKEEARAFRESGFPVDDLMRIDMRAFGKVFPPKTINNDIGEVAKNKTKFKKEPGKEIGDLLESTITLAINRYLFKGRFAALRTSEYDDIVGGLNKKEDNAVSADHLIIDKESGEIIATIDTTTSYKNKVEKLRPMLKNGAKADYGVKWNKDDATVSLVSLKNLPVFFIKFESLEVIDLAKSVISQKMPEVQNKESIQKLLSSLVKQAEEYSKLASPAMKQPYERAAKIFKSL